MHKATIKASIRISSITVDAQSLNRKEASEYDNQHILSSSNWHTLSNVYDDMAFPVLAVKIDW